MWVVGLGNPGSCYAGTRHNVGQTVLYRLVDRWKAQLLSRQPSYESFRAGLPGAEPIEIVLIAPLSMMNRSGEALADFERASGARLAAGETLVICDDVYLPVGSLRARAQGSTGGHRGLESVETFFGTSEYPRLRIGVGQASGEELVDHVLSRFEDEEREPLEEALGRSLEAVDTWAREGILATMNRFNRKSKEVSP